MGNKKLVLMGGGGHCLSIIDSLIKNDYDSIVILDETIEKGTSINGIKVYGNDTKLKELVFQGFQYAFITLGSIGNVSARKKINDKLLKNNFILVNIFDKSAVISPYAKLGNGIFVGKNAIVNANTVVEDNCIINSASVVEHECIIKEYVHIAPGSVILGNCSIGSNTHIGANTTIIQNTKIGNNVLVGMGSTVLHNINDNEKKYGII